MVFPRKIYEDFMIATGVSLTDLYWDLKHSVRLLEYGNIEQPQDRWRQVLARQMSNDVTMMKFGDVDAGHERAAQYTANMALHHELPGLFQYIRQRMGEYKQMYPSASPQESFQKGVLEYGMRLSPSAPPFQGRGLVFSRGRRAQVAPGPAAPAPAPAPASAEAPLSLIAGPPQQVSVAPTRGEQADTTPSRIRRPPPTPSPAPAPTPAPAPAPTPAPAAAAYQSMSDDEIQERVRRFLGNLQQYTPAQAFQRLSRELDATMERNDQAREMVRGALRRGGEVPLTAEEVSDRAMLAYRLGAEVLRDDFTRELFTARQRTALRGEVRDIRNWLQELVELDIPRPFGVASPRPSPAQERAAEERRRSPERDPGSPLFRPIPSEVAAQKQAKMRQQAQRTQARRAAEPEGIPSADVSQMERVPTEDVTITAAERVASPVMSLTQGDVAVPRAFRAFRGQQGRGRLRGGNDASLAAYLRDWMNRFAPNPEANRARAEAELRDYFLNEPQDGRIFDAYYETVEDMEMYDMDDVFDYVPAIIEMAEQPYEDELYQDSDDMEDVD
jgi:hypothetical protein